MGTDPTLDVDNWIERAVLDQLATHDRRYKYDYAGVERTTDDLVAACAQLDVLGETDGTGLPDLGAVMRREAEIEADVEEALEALAERGYVERVGERQRGDPLLGDPDADAGTTPVWEPTVEGRAQVRALREAYAAAIDEVVADYVGESTALDEGAEATGDDPDTTGGEPLAPLPDDVSDECTREMAAVARRYGILPW